MTILQRIGFVFLFTIFISIFQPCLAGDPPLPKPIGRVVWVKGALKAVMQNNEQRVLQKMSIIYLHDILITDAATKGEIALTDGSLITFYPSSRFSIDQYAYQPKAKSNSISRYVGNLIEGGFRTITGAIAKSNPANYQVNTPVATIGVRGTDFAVYYKNGSSYVARYKGKPCVKGQDKGRSELCLSDDVQYAKAEAKSAPSALSQMPAVFTEKLDIIPFSISPFGVQTTNQGGVVSSFCISQ